VRRQGVQVRARKGYWAPGAEDVKKALAPPAPEPPAAVTRALSAVADPPRGRLIRRWVGTSRGPDGKTRVSLVWEPLPPEPGRTRVQPSQITLLAMGADSRVYFRGRVPGEAAAGPPNEPTGAPAVSSGASGVSPTRASRVDFDAAPGPVQLRISVHGSGDDVVDTDMREVTVPDFTAPVVAIGTPAVFRAANAREFQAVKRDPHAVPTTGHEFRRTDRLLVRFDAYGPGGTRPSVRCRLLNRTGGVMSELQVSATDGSTSYDVDLPLSGLVAGVYLIEITAAGADSEATELVAVRIVA